MPRIADPIAARRPAPNLLCDGELARSDRQPHSSGVPPRDASRPVPEVARRVPVSPEPPEIVGVSPEAAVVCGAIWRCTLILALLLFGCGVPTGPAGVRVFSAEPPSELEDYCAWYGDARDGVLYFGQAPFWAAHRASGGDPRADLEHPGPQLVGRFDLERERLLPPLDVTAPGARSGVWDVHAHANGRIYFTTFYEEMGWVDPATGASGRFDGLGEGLNEIAAGPGETLLVTRYGGGPGRSGAVLQLSPEGELLAELAVPPPDGERLQVAPKTPAFDPLRSEVWTTNDLIAAEGGEIRYDAVVLGPEGRVLRRIAEPEIQFVAFGPDGSGHLAEVDARGLRLRQPRAGRTIPLDPGFARSLDFAQDVKPLADGRVVVSRWSGHVHVVSPDGQVASVRLPRVAEGGLYYTAVARGRRVCATHCGGVRVVCDDLD